MEVTLIYGREGSGKSGLIHRICNTKRIGGSKIAVIVPDQYTHQTELDLISAYNSSGLIDTLVLSFKRLSHRLKLLYGGASVIVLSDEGKAMLINRIISSLEQQENNALLSNVSKTDVCGDIAKLISRFKQYSVTPQMLEECAIDGEKYSHTKSKLDEIAKIYKAYVAVSENITATPLFDEEDDTMLLCSNIKESGIFAEYDVFLDGFDDFSNTELDVIEALITTSKSVTVSLPADLAVDNQRRILFNRQMLMINRLEDVVKKCSVIPKKIWLTDNAVFCPDNVDLLQMKENRVPAISYIEKNIFKTNCKGEVNNTKGVLLVKESNISSETEHASDMIVKLVRDEGLRYNEIAVICGNIDLYQRFVKESFSKRAIPFFMDTNRSIKDNAIIRFVEGLIDVAITKRSTHSVISLLRTGILNSGFSENTHMPFSYMDVSYLEKYCTQYYIKGKAWESDFKYGAEYFDLERLNEIRKKVLYYILPFESAWNEAKTAKDRSKALENYIAELEIFDVINEKIEYLRSSERSDIALEYNNIWNVLNSVLSQINMFMGDVEITDEDFCLMLGGCLENVKVNVIPACLDQVSVLGTGRTMAKHIKALFVLGADNISIGEETGIFNTAELDMLKTHDIDIGADSENIICDEEYYIYKILSKPTEFLYISRTNSEDSISNSTNPLLINAIKSVFDGRLKEIINPPVPYMLSDIDNIGSAESAMLYEMTTLNEKSPEYYKLDEWLKNNGGFKYNTLSKVVEKGKKYTLTTERAEADSIIKMRHGEYCMDISRLEKYIKCPYAYFVKYCLRPNSDAYAKVSAVDVGNVVHNLLDMFTKTVMNSEQPTALDVRNFIDTYFDEAVAQYETGKFQAMEENKYVLKRVKIFLTKMMTVMAERKCCGSTVLFATELVFDDYKKDKNCLPAIECIDVDGVKFKITGKIDCVEYYNAKDGRYWIVNDYKTGRNPSNTDIIKGRSLQLPVYMFALLKNDAGSMPGAMFYVSVNDDLSKPDGNEIASLVKKRYGKVGIISDNEELYMGIDRDCKKSDSDNSYDIKKSQSIADAGKLNIVEADEMSDIVSNAIKTAGDIFFDIRNGYITKAPMSQKECSYCEYRRFCGYDPKLKNIDERRYASKSLSDEEAE